MSIAHVRWGFGQNMFVRFHMIHERYKVWYGKIRTVWLSEGEKIEDMFIRFDRMHVRTLQTHGQTDGRTPHDG